MGAAVVIGGLGLLQSHSAGRKAEKANREQAKAAAFAAKKQQRIDDIQAQRRRVAAARENRRVLASHTNLSESSGVSSSGATGFAGSVRSQYTSAVAASRNIDSLRSEISIFNTDASQNAARLFGQSASLSNQADLFKGVSDLTSIFTNG